MQGTFVDGALHLTLPGPATGRYRLQPDGMLEATYEWAGRVALTQLTRVPD